MRLRTLTTAAIGGAVGVGLAASPALADVEIGATAGIHVFNADNELGVPESASDSSDRSLSNSVLFGIRVGYFLNDYVGVELEGGAIPTESRGDVHDVWALTYRAQVVAQILGAKSKLRPFILVGAGAMQVVSTDDESVISSDTDELVYVGAGLKYAVDGGWGLRFDARALFPPSSGSEFATIDGEALVSVYHVWGAKAEQAPPPKEPEVEAPKDEDGDGLVGDADKCPTEAEDKDGFQDEDGCPDADNDGDGVADDADQCKNDPEDADGYQDEDGCPETDNDGDGVLDAADQCKTDPEDKDNFQDDDGCPDLDNDGDGVLDAADQCPDTLETKNGYQDGDGCPDEIPLAIKKFTGVIKGINFKTGSAEILKNSFKTLDAAVKVLQDYPDLRMEIQGHTDDTGSADVNRELSQRRAESVRAYFAGKGVDENRLVAKGYGPDKPIDARKNKAARAKNRRVEFILISELDAAAPAEAPAGARAEPVITR